MWNIALITAVFSLSLFVTGCDDAEQAPPAAQPQPTGSLVRVEGCKSTLTGTTAGTACLRYTYDPATKKLSLTHVNAGFNCCPEQIHAAVTVTDGTIRIVESETGPNCRCNCLYDLDIVVESIRPQAYTVMVDEPLLDAREVKMEFPIDLSSETMGEHCVPRNMYPWGM